MQPLIDPNIKYVEEKKKTIKEINDIEVKKLEEKYEWEEVDTNWWPAILVFVGHVDSGKSTTIGKLMELTG